MIPRKTRTHHALALVAPLASPQPCQAERTADAGLPEGIGYDLQRDVRKLP